MSDYTIESPKKKKHYYKGKNKHRADKNTEVDKDNSLAPVQEPDKAQKDKKTQRHNAPVSSQAKDNSEEKDQKQHSHKSPKPQKDQGGKNTEHKNFKKNKKHGKEAPAEDQDIALMQENAPEIRPVPSFDPSVKKKSDDFISYFSDGSDSKHDYHPDPKAEGFAKDPPFTDFSTAYDPVADYMKEKELQKEAATDEDPTSEIKTVIGIRFRTSTKTYYFDPLGVEYVDESFAIVETARGTEFGFVVMGNREVPVSKSFLPLRPALRPATKADKEHYAQNRKKEEEAVGVWNEKVLAHGLEMKLIDVEYTFDNTKLLFYFTSEGRVDFRELVKDLASMFHCRIELRQMGIRDEAKVLGGLGVCGRAFCCGTFLPDFAQVSIKMAKEQAISLNSSKISGACGRLMCCLRFEHEAYLEAIQRTPSVDWKVKTPFGTGVVVETKPLAGLIKVKLDDNPDAVPTIVGVEDAIVIGKDKSKKAITEDEDCDIIEE